jgi:hypothetical protein
MADLDDDIAVFNEMRRELELQHIGKWVLIFKKELIDVFDTFDQAANAAVK